MKLEQSKTLPTTKSVLRFDDDEVVKALKMLAKEKGYIISKNGKCYIWHPSRPGEARTSLVIDSDGSEFSIKNFDKGEPK